MQEAKVLVVFYLSDEINIKDIDREIYTDDKKMFHLFFFHNIDLDTDRQTILNKTILKELETVAPVMDYNEKQKTLTMTKKIENFVLSDIDEKVEEDYIKHLDSVEYRISCIIDTYKLFSKLYKDKTIIFFMPEQISKKFLEYIKGIQYKEIKRNDEILKYYDIIHWANYFSKVFTESTKKNKIDKKNITKILEIFS